MFSIYTELQRPNIRRMKKVVHRSTGITTVIYLLTGFFGYLHYTSTLSGNILRNMTPDDPLSTLTQVQTPLRPPSSISVGLHSLCM